MTRYTFTVVSSATIYKHGLTVVTVGQLAKPAENDTTSNFVGLAEVAPTGVGDGTVTVTVVNDLDVLLPLVTAITAGNIGDAVYAVDDGNATTENTLGPEIGTLVQFVAANSGWVRLRAKALSVAS